MHILAGSTTFHKNTVHARFGVLVFRVFRVDNILEGHKGDQGGGQNSNRRNYDTGKVQELQNEVNCMNDF